MTEHRLGRDIGEVFFPVASLLLCFAGCGAADTQRPASTQLVAAQATGDAAPSASSPSLAEDALDASASPLAVAPADASSTDKPCEYAKQPSRPAPQGRLCNGGDASAGCIPPPCTAVPRSLMLDGPVASTALLNGSPDEHSSNRGFNRSAATTSLVAMNVSECAVPGGPLAEGHVKITFATSGRVSSVEVDTPPFADTAVGACVANKFRGARVPPFEGTAVTVGKTFAVR